MRAVDWAVLLATLVLIVAYGIWRTRGIRSVDAYLRGGSDTRWLTIGLSIMATQASAITFLSTPGQGYEDGMGFVQFYLGLPIAMVILSATIVPLYKRLKVYTAYEYLESRFDLKTRQLTAFLFLLQRGLGAGISIYAPAIILSTVLGWPLHLTNIAIGALVILYTVSGGTRAVNQTQTYQMAVMLGGMALAFFFVLSRLPANVSFGDALGIAGALGKMKVIDYSTRLDTRYTFWSGMTGGLFVALAYFGTDQSQVQRYLSGASLTESRLGLLFNALVKVPMQFMILLVGVIVFVFYQFNPPPVFFNEAELNRIRSTPVAAELQEIESAYGRAFLEKKNVLDEWLSTPHWRSSSPAGRDLKSVEAKLRGIRERAKDLIAKADPRAERNDADYVFISFVLKHFPPGLVGLLVAVVLCAAMSATAAALNALGTTTVVDFYQRTVKPGASNDHYLLAAKLFTVFWGIVGVLFAAFASLLDNLIQAVNILGSIFYGPMLGVFLVGFFLKRVGGTPVFWATLLAQLIVVIVFRYSTLGFLWYNVIGCAAVVVLSLGFNLKRATQAVT
ncbi:MAG TPA: sodium:solute symporter [Myxococcaceae bacterium]|nr:sodium:solute symporter [Myxococcaceae bacterium]